MDLINQALQMQQQSNTNLTNSFLKMQEAGINQANLERQQKALALQLAKEAHDQQQDAVRNQQQNNRYDLLVQGQQRQNFAPLNEAVASAATNYNKYIENQWNKLDQLGREQTDLYGSIKGLAPAFGMRLNAQRADLANASRELDRFLSQSTPQAAAATWIPAASVGKTALDQAVAQELMHKMYASRQAAGDKWTPQMQQEEWKRLSTEYLDQFKAGDELGMKEKRLNEIIQMQQALQAQLENPGQPYTDPVTGKKSPSRIQTQEEYLNRTLAPIINMYNMTNAQVMPGGLPRTSNNNYPITDQAVIATLADSTPIKISPTSFGGTMKTEDGRTIIVPSKNATLTDIGRIQRANQEGKKIFDKPMLEDVVPKEVEGKDPLPPVAAEGPKYLQQQVSQKKQSDDAAAMAQQTEEYSKAFEGEVNGLAHLLQSFKANPQGENITYPQFLKSLALVSQDLYDKNKNAAGSPERVYANLVTKLKEAQYGGKPLLGTLQSEQSAVNSLQNLYGAWDAFSATKGNERAQSPWAMGHWVTPAADAAGWQALLSVVRAKTAEEERKNQGK